MSFEFAGAAYENGQIQNRERYVNLYLERRRHKGLSQADAFAALANPLLFAALMVTAGDAVKFTQQAAPIVLVGFQHFR